MEPVGVSAYDAIAPRFERDRALPDGVAEAIRATVLDAAAAGIIRCTPIRNARPTRWFYPVCSQVTTSCRQKAVLESDPGFRRR